MAFGSIAEAGGFQKSLRRNAVKVRTGLGEIETDGSADEVKLGTEDGQTATLAVEFEAYSGSR